MGTRELLVVCVVVLPGVAAFIELFRLLPIVRDVQIMTKTSQKAFSVVRSSRISDHWKERALRFYSGITLRASLRIAWYLLLLFAAFSAAFGVAGLLLYGGPQKVIELSTRWETLVIAVVLGTLYAVVRNRLTAGMKQDDSDYGAADRALHYLALSSRPVREMAFDMDSMAARSARKNMELPPPVYVSGLARAGTTILLEALYATGAFTTLTYRNMPFVLSPYLWSRFSRRHHREANAKERAHGDRLMVDFDSPEAFEEVFWMTFSADGYIREQWLDPCEAGEEVLENYRTYVANVVAAHCKDRPLRYLAKNNNNILRIGSIRQAFPDATVIVPVRNPIDHARSLLRQHERFTEKHSSDPFSLKYMNWLGHFEFGANLRPFHFGPDALPRDKDEPLTIEYWLRYWGVVHEYLLSHHSGDVVFLDYDRMCEQPEETLGALEARLSLPGGSLVRFAPRISKAPHREEQGPALSDKLRQIHQALRDASI